MGDTGTKHDSGKLRFDLLPPEALEALVEVYTLGAAKYGDNQYLGGMAWSRIYASMMRHLQACWQGEDYDPENGQLHLASLAWGAFTLITYMRRGLGTDDRPDLSPSVDWDDWDSLDDAAVDLSEDVHIRNRADIYEDYDFMSLE